jgi:hypothetical protein
MIGYDDSQHSAGNADARQFWFDIERGEIENPILRPDVTATMFLCRLARLEGEQLVKVLEAVLATHYNAYIRVAALESLLLVDPSNAAHYSDIASKDPKTVVRRLAQKDKVLISAEN